MLTPLEFLSHQPLTFLNGAPGFAITPIPIYGLKIGWPVSYVVPNNIDNFGGADTPDLSTHAFSTLGDLFTSLCLQPSPDKRAACQKNQCSSHESNYPCNVNVHVTPTQWLFAEIRVSEEAMTSQTLYDVIASSVTWTSTYPCYRFCVSIHSTRLRWFQRRKI